MLQKSVYLAIVLFLVSLQAFTINTHLGTADFPDWEPVPDLNATSVIPYVNATPIPINPWDFVKVPEPTYHYGILARSLMELAVNTMVCGWIALVAMCSTVYLVNRRFVWGRKKTIGVILLTVVGGVVFSFWSWLYQVRPYVLDAEFVYSGYPFVWLTASRSVFWGSPEWTYDIQWYGFIGNIMFYMWIIFGVIVGFTLLPEMLAKLRFSKRSA
jgi:hypothetical protein